MSKNAKREPFSVSLISGIERKIDERVGGGGSVKTFRRNFPVSQCQKISWGNPSMLCFRKFLIAKKFTDKREGEVSKFSFEIFWSHSAEKSS